MLTVTSPKSWLLLGALSALLMCLLVWAWVGQIPTHVLGQGVLGLPGTSSANAEAVLFIPTEDSRSVRTGMPVQLGLAIGREQANGFLIGRVTTVGSAPATREKMLRATGNDALVDALASAGKLIEVRVQLFPDEAASGQYRWTIPQSTPVELHAGSMLNGSILVDQKQPIVMAFPFLESVLTQ